MLPLLTNGTARFLIPRQRIQSPHTYVRCRVDLHLPSPTTAIPGLDTRGPLSRHRSLPPISTAAPSQPVLRDKPQGRGPVYLHAPTHRSHLAQVSPRGLLVLADWPSCGEGAARGAVRREGRACAERATQRFRAFRVVSAAERIQEPQHNTTRPSARLSSCPGGRRPAPRGWGERQESE